MLTHCLLYTTMDDPAKYHEIEILANCVSLIGVSVLSFCLSRRVPRGWRQWKHLTWGRACVLLVLLDSWLFVFFAGLLASGISISWSQTTCSLAIYTCISFYAISKILIYAFLSEKVYIVWTGGNQNSRLKARVYRVCAVVLLGYVVVGTLTVIGRDSTIRRDGVCIIGLKSYATISLIVYDMSLNIFLTAMFLWPLWLSHPMSPKLRSIAKRTLYGASTSLVSSMINIAILFLLGGNELGWVCLSSCVADVTVNSLALFWLSSGSSWSGDVVRDRFSLPTMDMSALTFVHIESATRPTLSGQPSTIIVSESTQDSHQPHVSMIPEAYFDYIPSEHRTLRNDTEEKTISGSSTVPENHHAQPSKASSETAGQTATMEEEKDICDL
ncbi:hypothetical protein HHX47_DHR5000845 [Lentinula edodes]|nr:hypothetical protein HHX47_DHR5000845 [Lentinula edodes]